MSKFSKRGEKTREGARHRRKARVRARVQGTGEKPRLCIFRSNRFTYAQLISDDDGTVLASASTRLTPVLRRRVAKRIRAAP